MHIKRHILIAIALLIFATGCTLDDGEPWGHVDAQLTVAEPEVAASFEVDSFELEIETVRLIETTAGGSATGEFDPQNPPAGCSLCHGGHCHCDGELVDYDELRARVADGGADRRVLANVAPDDPITSAGAVELGLASIDERVSIDTVEVELAAVLVRGTLTIDGQDHPTTMSLPGIGGTRFSAPVSLDFGPDSPEVQPLELALVWADGWLEDVDVSALDTTNDSEILIASSANRDAARIIADHVAESSIEVHMHGD